MDKEENPFVTELKEKVPSKLLQLLAMADGAALLLEELPKIYSPKTIATPSPEQRKWELVGLYYLNSLRYHEAIIIFTSFYEQMLKAQQDEIKWVHKGMPLVYISQCYAIMRYPALAKRYLMLTLCEDALREQGKVSSTTGVYFRIVWFYGLPDSEVNRYAKEINDLSIKYPKDSLYPEWLLQELDQNWMTEIPSTQEAAFCPINKYYIHHLMLKLGDKTGKALEQLAAYLLSCMPGCRTHRRQRSKSTDYDIVCSLGGLDVDFRSELGRYFVCECKDWHKPADFSAMAKFCRVLDSTKSRFGILFSRRGITGRGKIVDAEREQLKIFQDRGIVIIVVDENDLGRVEKGENFISLLRTKYERVRLDLIR